MKKKTLWLTETAMLIALLIVLQAVTKSWGQIVTGSFVNTVLALSVLTVGLWSGVTVAALSPFFAFVLGIGPQLIAIVPAIAVGNVVLVVVLWALTKGHKLSHWKTVIAWAAASVCKFLTLYLIVVKVLCSVLPLKAPQVATFSTMFSWPQLFTALIGTGVALLIAPIVRKGLNAE